MSVQLTFLSGVIEFPLTNRIVGTECASCCGACRSWQFPWLFIEVSKSGRTRFQSVVLFGGRGLLTHFEAGKSKKKKVSKRVLFELRI